jgi:hypothetical protein
VEERPETLPALPARLIVPWTGEVLDASPATACRALLEARRLREQIKVFEELAREYVLLDSQRQGTKTLHYGEATATVKGDRELVWDMTELVKLLDAGLPQERYNDLVTEEVSYKVNAAVAKQLEAANEKYAAIIGQARHYLPKRPYVSVT